MRSFAELLKRHRKAVGLSQSALADEATVAKSYIAKLEQGSSSPSGLALVKKLSEALAISPALLFGHLDPANSQSTRLPDPHGLAVAFLDRNLFVGAANDQWEYTLPGCTSNTSLLEWLFTNPRAPLVLEDWDIIAHAAAWWISALGTNPQEAEKLKEYPKYQRFIDAPYSAAKQRAMLQKGAIAIREMGTSTVRRHTLDAYQGLTNGGFVITLSLDGEN